MKYSKPYLSPSEQIELLVSRGMHVQDTDVAQQYLVGIGYYRLSAYWFPFRKKIPSSPVPAPSITGRYMVLDEFVEDANFQNIIDIYNFDRKLRLIILDALERIEIALRTDVALLLGKLSPVAHRHQQYLNGNFTRHIPKEKNNTRHFEWLERQDHLFLRSKEIFAQHFKTKYNSDAHPPIWIAVEAWDFGLLSVFFQGMKPEDQNNIALKYKIPNGLLLSKWIRSLNDCRNICAHHGRLWDRGVVNYPEWEQLSDNEFLCHILMNKVSCRKIYSTFLCIAYFMRSMSFGADWLKDFILHMQSFPAGSCLSLSDAGFPKDWETLPIWVIDQ
ncbi:Abi family protein [Microvirga sp. W0021]|uniref:Abi family protein n=1 Tax=Hohaiivirga grylli TaxID=3133970 RepID=A0ABV0BJ18_9HYPH